MTDVQFAAILLMLVAIYLALVNIAFSVRRKK